MKKNRRNKNFVGQRKMFVQHIPLHNKKKSQAEIGFGKSCKVSPCAGGKFNEFM